MKQTGRCPKCGSEDVLPDVAPLADPADPKGEPAPRPGAWLFRGKRATRLVACVCARCGYTELYAKEPRGLVLGHGDELSAFCPACSRAMDPLVQKCPSCGWEWPQGDRQRGERDPGEP